MAKLNLILLVSVTYPISLFSSKEFNADKLFSIMQTPSSSPSFSVSESPATAAASADASKVKSHRLFTLADLPKENALQRSASCFPFIESMGIRPNRVEMEMIPPLSLAPSILPSFPPAPQKKKAGESPAKKKPSSLDLRRLDDSRFCSSSSSSSSSTDFAALKDKESQKRAHAEISAGSSPNNTRGDPKSPQAIGSPSRCFSSPEMSPIISRAYSPIILEETLPPAALPIEPAALPIEPKDFERLIANKDIIVVATAIPIEFEATKLAFARHSPIAIESRKSMPMVSCTFNDKIVIIALIGKGPADAAASTQCIISKFKASLKVFFLTGICGSLSQDLLPGDVIIPEFFEDLSGGYFFNHTTDPQSGEVQYLIRDGVSHRLSRNSIGKLNSIGEFHPIEPQPIPACCHLFSLAQQLVDTKENQALNRDYSEVKYKELKDEIRKERLMAQGLGRRSLSMSMALFKEQKKEDDVTLIAEKIRQKHTYKYMRSKNSIPFQNLTNARGELAKIKIGGIGASFPAFVDRREVAEAFNQKFGADVVDMESEPVVKTCIKAINNIPVIVVKSPSDMAGTQQTRPNECVKSEIDQNRFNSAFNAAIVVEAMINCLQVRQCPPTR